MNHSFKILLAAIFAFTTCTAFAQTPPGPTPAQIQESEQYQDQICRTQSKEACLAAQGWHYWLIEWRAAIKAGLSMTVLSGTTYTIAYYAEKKFGESEITQVLMQFSQAGLRAGAYTIGAGVTVFVVGTLAMSASFLLGSTTSTASKVQDEPSVQCQQILAPYKTAEGLQKLLTLPPELRDQVFPCIQYDSGLSQLFHDAQRNGSQIENQIQRP